MNGLSAIISGLSLIGFLIFLAGVGLVVVNTSQGKPAGGGTLMAGVGLVAAILLLIISQGVVVVDPTEVAIIINTLNGDVEEPKHGGTHIILPGIQRVAVTYSTLQNSYTMSSTPTEGQISGDDSIEVQTSDLQRISLDATVFYRVDANNINTLYERWRDRDYEAEFVRPVTRSIIRDVAAQYDAQEIASTERTAMVDEMEQLLTEAFAGQGLEMVDLRLREVTFSDEYRQIIDQVQQEQQRVELIQAQAQQDVARAEGQASAREAQARGEANATRINAEAQADALAVVSAQLAANPLLVQYLYVQNLSDNVNLALIPSNSPFIFDINTLLEQQNSDLQVPDVPDTTEVTPAAP